MTWSGGALGWIGRAGPANGGPINIRAKILATDGAARCALYVRATFRRNSTLLVRPLVDEHGMGSDLFREISLPPAIREEVFMQVHAEHVSASLNIFASASLDDFVSNSLSNARMTNDEVRRHRLGVLADELGGLGRLAAAIDKSSSQVSQWKNASPDSKTGKPRVMSDDMARFIERQTGKPRGWMDIPPEPAQAEPDLFAEVDVDINKLAADLAKALAEEAVEIAHQWLSLPIEGRAAVSAALQKELRYLSKVKKSTSDNAAVQQNVPETLGGFATPAERSRQMKQGQTKESR